MRQMDTMDNMWIGIIQTAFRFTAATLTDTSPSSANPRRRRQSRFRRSCRFSSSSCSNAGSLGPRCSERNHDEPFSRAARTALRRSLDPATPWIVPRLACAGIEDSPDPCSIIALRFRRNVKSAMSGQNLLTQKTTPPYNQPILPIDRIVCNRIERRRNHV